MKQKAIKIFMFLILAISLPMLFVGCNKQTQRLSKPEIAIEETDNQVFVKCTAINNASGYCFQINNIPFISDKPNFNLSEVMVEYKTYVIKAYAIGTGKYTNSRLSNILTYRKQKKFNTPMLNITGTVLSWSAIENAQTYLLKVNNSAPIEFAETQVDIKANLNIFNLINVNKNNTFEVKVKAYNDCNESEYSNTVNYSETSILNSATNLHVSQINNKSYLTWHSEYNNISFKVYLNDVEISTTTSKELEVTQYLTQAKDYIFAVECISDSVLVQNSEKSEPYTHINLIRLSKPEINNIYLDNENNVIVEWNKVENAISYRVTVNQTETYQVYSEKHVFIFESIKNYAQDELSFTVKAIGYNNYLDSAISTQETFNPYSKLSIPEEVKIENVNNIAFLSFKAVENARTYIISVNDVEFESESTYINLSQYVNSTQLYSIKIKCKAYNFFKESDFSEIFNYNHTYFLEKPTNVNAEITNNVLQITWKGQDNAAGYNVKITFESAIIVSTTTINTFNYTLYSGGEYSYCVQALGDNLSYFDGEYSEQQEIVFVKKINAPSNFKYQKDNSYLILSWGRVSNVKHYQLTYNNKTISVLTEKIKILLSEFNKGSYVFELKAIAEDNIYYTDSSVSTLTYQHGNSQNVGELFYVNNNYYDFFIESYEEFVELIDYAHQFQKNNVSFYANFNYSEDLTSNNYYESLKDLFENYNIKDETIRNEVISAIITVNAENNMKLISIAKENTKLTLTFEFTNDVTEELETTVISPDKQFTAYKNGSKLSSIYCETLPTLPAANNINSTMQILNVINNERKPQFETSIKGVNVAGYYNKFIQILNENISATATDYQKALAIYSYLMANTSYDFECEKYVTENNVNFENYFSYNIEGVAKHSKATSVGLAKTFTLMCLMEGVKATYNIALENGIVVGYSTVKIDDEWFIVDFYKSVIINNEINSVNNQYFTYYYFLNNSSELSYLNSTTQSWPENKPATSNINYFENFNTTIGNCKLVVSDIDSITEIVTYCINNNKLALEIQLDMDFSSFVSLVELAKTMDYITDCKYFNNSDKTVFVKIVL